MSLTIARSGLDRRWLRCAAVLLLAGLFIGAPMTTKIPRASAEPAGKVAAAGKSVYDFSPLDITGQRVPLSRYKGDVLLIVNTASLCGNTPQYASLEKLYEKYKGHGLRILAFPANNFASQEPGNNGTIRDFCTSKYHVTFDMFSKISVAGADQAPLYSYLTSTTSDPQFGKPIEWNFAKFLVDRNGRIVNRFPAGHDPLSSDVVAAVEQALNAAAK